ncbi:MAG: hypothetical protein IH951_11805 [Bacteroidetes bacterium]|nr:hypothetical protein [Bacteroidota bacterium]
MSDTPEENSKRIRETCVQCALKHIGQAHILFYEKEQGYPRHHFIGLAHLAEAQDELAQMFPGWATRVRIIRKAKETDHELQLDLGRLIEELAAFDKEYAESELKRIESATSEEA